MSFSNHVKVKFGADTKGFHGSLDKANKSVSKFGDTFKSRVVGVLGTAVLAKTTTDVINFGAAIGDMSVRLGASTSFLQTLQYGAEQSGVKAEGASIAFQRFTRRTAEAKAKAGPLRDALTDLGITMTDANGNAKSSEQLFREFGTALTTIDDPAKKVKTAFQFLDTEGVALAQMFVKGGKTLDDYGKEAKALGMIMEDDTITALRNADGELKKASRQFKVFASGIIPPVIKILRTAKVGFDLVVASIKGLPTALKVLGTSIKEEIMAKFKLAGATLAKFEAEAKAFAVKINPFMEDADVAKAEQAVLDATANMAKAQADADKSLKQRREEIFKRESSYAKDRTKFQQEHKKLQGEFNAIWGKGNKARADAVPIQNKLVELTKEEKEMAKKTATARDENTKAIERSTQKLKALIDGGEDARKAVQARHDLEDKINALVAKGNIPRKEAEKIAIKLAGHAKAEQQLLALMKGEKDRLAQLGQQQAQAEQQVEQAMKDQLALQQQAKVAMDAELAIMQAKANGQDDLAKKLQAELDMKDRLKNMADQMNVAEGKAVGILDKRLKLEKDIALKKVQQEAQIIKNGAIEKLAERDIRDAIDAKDRKRIRAGKDVQRLEEKIRQLQDQGGARADAEIKKLQAVKDRKLEIALDDKTKDDLKQLEKKRIDIKDNHDAQMQALNKRMGEVAKEEAKMRKAEQDAKAEAKARNDKAVADFNQRKAKIEADLDKNMVDNKDALNKVKTSHIDAFKDLGKKLWDNLKLLKLDAVPTGIKDAGSQVEKAILDVGTNINSTLAGININPPDPSIQTAIMDSLAKIADNVATEKTLTEVNETLKGKFVNQ